MEIETAVKLHIYIKGKFTIEEVNEILAEKLETNAFQIHEVEYNES